MKRLSPDALTANRTLLSEIISDKHKLPATWLLQGLYFEYPNACFGGKLSEFAAAMRQIADFIEATPPKLNKRSELP